MSDAIEVDEELKRLKEWECRAVESMDAACKSLGVECCNEIPDKVLELQKELCSIKARDQIIISWCKIWGGEAMRVVPMLSTQTGFSVGSAGQTQSR